MAIVADCETTGLLVPSSAPIEQQPYLVELYCAKIDEEFNIVEEFDTLIKPPIPIPDETIKIHNITNEMVADAPSFIDIYPDLAKFFLGEEIFVAHNASFDASDIYYELVRINKEKNFPWPPIHHCTIEMSMHLKGHKLNLAKLHEMATGESFDGAHRAKADTEALLRCYKWLMKK